MHTTGRSVATLLVGLTLVAAARISILGAAQAPAQAPAGPPVPRFPAQQRPPDDPLVVARGKRVYDISCRACHGADLRGGDMGGPNLLRSDVMLNDAKGELLAPIIQGSRANTGMPAVALSPDDVVAVAVYVHSVLATGRAQGAPPAAPLIPVNILVGDARAGQVYFTATCSACHSTTGDLQGIGAKVSNPVELQNLWVAGGHPQASAPGGPPSRRDVTVSVTPPSGPRVEGRLDRIDDFTVTLVLADGSRRTFRRTGDVPQVELNDPLVAHKRLLETYADRDIHNVTAYLVTVK